MSTTTRKSVEIFQENHSTDTDTVVLKTEVLEDLFEIARSFEGKACSVVVMIELPSYD